jgi:lipopolysaccharide transport protein LptA
MKRFRFILPLAAALTLRAQTNSPPSGTVPEAPVAAPVAAASTNAATGSPSTDIYSDSANFDLKSRVAVYIGHVRIEESQMKMTCGIMTASVPESGKIDHIVAEQNVVIDAVDNEGKPVHATGDKAVYVFRVVNSVTNETIVLTGNPRVEKQGGWLTGETITWDRVNNSFGATRQHMVIQQQLIESNVPPQQTPEKK